MFGVCIPLLVVLLAAPSYQQNSIDNITVTLYCEPGPTYIFFLENASKTGTIFVNGTCREQNTIVTTGNYTFNDKACTVSGKGAPPINTMFYLTVTANNDRILQLDKTRTYSVMCEKDLTPVKKIVSVGTGLIATDFRAGGVDGDLLDALAPKFTIDIEDENNVSLAVGLVGNMAQIVITMTQGFEDGLGFRASSILANGQEIVKEGCSVFRAIFPHPNLPVLNKLVMPFELFRVIGPDSTINDTLEFTVYLEICDNACSEPVCLDLKRKKRSDELVGSTQLTDSVRVLAPQTGGETQIFTQPKDKDTCGIRTATSAVLVSLLMLSFLLCALLTCRLCVIGGFQRRRKSERRDSDTWRVVVYENGELVRNRIN